MYFSKLLPQGEYLLRLQSRTGHLMAADVLEGKYDGRCLTLQLMPSVMDHFLRYAARGACWMARVGERGGRNIVTRLAFLGHEDDQSELN
jgi:hypothetical protein